MADEPAHRFSQSQTSVDVHVLVFGRRTPNNASTSSSRPFALSSSISTRVCPCSVSKTKSPRNGALETTVNCVLINLGFLTSILIRITL